MDIFTKDLTLEGCKEKQKDIGGILKDEFWHEPGERKAWCTNEILNNKQCQGKLELVPRKA